MEGFGFISTSGVGRIYKEGPFPSKGISFLSFFSPQSTPKTSLRTRDLISISVINITLYLKKRFSPELLLSILSRLFIIVVLARDTGRYYI